MGPPRSPILLKGRKEILNYKLLKTSNNDMHKCKVRDPKVYWIIDNTEPRYKSKEYPSTVEKAY